MGRIVLILMVKNESRILERCLRSVEGVVDAFCIHDTGSTDNTVEIAKTWLRARDGCVTTSEWKNFGYNRTESFRGAKAFVESQGWDLKTTYGLLLDADMMFHAGVLKGTPLTDLGYTILQRGGTLEYPNCRLVRMDRDWVCRGVTHEYWDGPTTPLPKSVCYIQDENDGGCKADKFERDARLLEQGLAEEPTNERYMFYLAQTYHSLGRWKDCIRMYKKRFAAGGWDEERWYSLYMIGQAWLCLDNPRKFEDYMLRAYEYRPTRAENIYRLAKYFREKSQHHKAFYYVQLGRNIPKPGDSLFIETPVYTGLFDYEATILYFYLNQKKTGLRESMRYLLREGENMDSVHRNMTFYVEPIGKEFVNHPILRDVVGRDYHPTSVSTLGDIDNVRFVNYSINHEGGYDMKQGNYSPSHPVRTQNVCFSPTGVRQMKDESVDLPRVDTHIYGLEDVRIYQEDIAGPIRFLSTSREYSDKIRIVAGVYNPETASYSNCKVIQSPLKSDCEKNWIPIPGTTDIVYSWNPLRVGRIVEDELVFHTELKTPWFFQHLRGSAIPIRVGDDLWCLVHYVEHCSPRKYFHCVVKLNPASYKPSAITLPFVFKAHGIEYCMSMTQRGKNIRFVFSSWDDNPCITEVPMDALEWIQV